MLRSLWHERYLGYRIAGPEFILVGGQSFREHSLVPRIPNMTSLGRLKSALRSAWLPLALLLIALSTVFVFGGDRGYFYRGVDHNWSSSEQLTIAVNLSLEHGFQRFHRRFIDEDGAVRYSPYNRYPIGGYAGMKLATLPVSGNPSAQIYAARVLMLLLFAGAAVLAYLSLCRLTSNRWIALTATLLAFSSYHLLYYKDMTASEGIPAFFGVMLTFHGMVVFVQEGRFRQLIVKTCVALLLGWHVYALLLPFVIIGLASDLLRARSASATPLYQVKRTAPVLLRSRYLLLGAVALVFGLSVLTFNFTMEYIALDGETPLTELPSFQSILNRTGGDSEFNAAFAAYLSWRPFLEGQFRRIFRMFIPYSLLIPLGYHGDPPQSPTWLSEFQGVVLGVVLSSACLIGSLFVRPRILFATLASFGFFWALPMRNSTTFHNFETIYYIGLPLVFFTIALLLVRRLTNREGVIAAAAVVALLLFAVSSFQISRVGYSAETAQTARDAEQDLLAIRDLTAGDLVTVLPIGGDHKSISGVAVHAVDYYLNTSLIRYRDLSSVEGGFVVMRERIDTDALLTPQNQYFFLYDRVGLEAMYRTVASGEPLASEEFDVYLIDGTMYYIKEPCYGSDFTARLFLHVFPEDIDDLRDDRRKHKFDNLDFIVGDHRLLFDGKCLAIVDIPQYDIAGLRTGRIDGGIVWSAAHVVQGPKLISEYESFVSREPIAHSEFDLYLEGGNLYYVKEPCTAEDTQAGFFLHVVPADENDLPDDRRQHGFDNLDFGFDVRGVLFDGKCAAAVPLPQYAIDRITTGQFDGTGRVWEIEFAPDTRE